MILPASHDVLGVMDVFGIVKLCQRVQKGLKHFFQRVEVHCLPSSKILFGKNSEQLAEVKLLNLTLKICRWLYISQSLARIAQHLHSRLPLASWWG